MDMSLQGRVALVTGASKGIGKGIASALALEGCRVCMVARDAQVLDAAAAALRASGNPEILALPGDVSDPNLAARVSEQLAARWGGVDILINNAAGPPPGSFLEHDEPAWRDALDRNFLSVVRLVRAVAPGMKQRSWGRIISITSTIAKEPTPQMVLSASARAAVSAFTKAIAVELAPFNVTANVVCPGGVQTERLESLLRLSAEREGKSLEEVRKRSVASIPMQRFASTEEIASLVVFLASQRAAYLTGLSLMADGCLTKSVY
jgi:3-oxoacyl-[acyl-carrier protein] reductase